MLDNAAQVIVESCAQDFMLVGQGFAGDEDIDWEDRTHFYRLSAHLMRQLVVQNWRRRNAEVIPTHAVFSPVRDGSGRVVASTVIFNVSHAFPADTTFVGLHIHEGAAGANGLRPAWREPMPSRTQAAGSASIARSGVGAGWIRKNQCQ